MSTTLWDMTAGQSAVLSGYADELDRRYLTRLTELGFHPGERVVCVHAPRFGAPKVYRVSNSVFSIEDTIARLIRMAPVEAAIGAAETRHGAAGDPVTDAA
ncbi:MAG TPA: FeoA family protein [Pseudomonadales bacterium]|nr:FeoA family protein [Pseudomonadales bacterium]